MNTLVLQLRMEGSDDILEKKSPKLYIKPRKYTAASTVISIRIPKDMLYALDEMAEKSGRTRNEFIYLGLEFALEHIKITEE